MLHFTGQIISVNGLVDVKSMCAALDVTCKLRGTPGPRVWQFGTPERNSVIDFGVSFRFNKENGEVIVKTQCMRRGQAEWGQRYSANNAADRH